MTKRYRLLGKENTIEYWCNEFPFMWGRDFADPKYGFEEVKERPERIGVTIIGSDVPGWITQIHPNKPSHSIPLSKHSEIKQAIEQVLNSTTTPSSDSISGQVTTNTFHWNDELVIKFTIDAEEEYKNNPSFLLLEYMKNWKIKQSKTK